MDDRKHVSCQRLKSLKSDLDGLMALEAQCYEHPNLTEGFYSMRVQVIVELAKIVLANKWDSDNTEGVTTSKEAIQQLERFDALMTTLQSSLNNTTNHDLREHFKNGIKNCIADMQNILIIRKEAECTDIKDKPQDLAPTIELSQLVSKHQHPQETTQQLQPQETSKEVVKKSPQQEHQKDLNIIDKKPTETEMQGLTSVVDDTPTKTLAPVLAKELSIANRGQIIIHNNFYKVNLGTLGELENNLFFSLCNRLKDKKDIIIRFSPQELKALAGDRYMPNKRLYKLTIDLFNNIAGANFDLIKMLEDEKMQRSKVMFFRKFEVQYLLAQRFKGKFYEYEAPNFYRFKWQVCQELI
ncbi:hypothetical protein NHP200010_04210 [Helicobacter bizzozeronii]|uniref:hypothetical protein n=1 Tax=Helicobacter bizzozeronii TaxID=56877 RepID=UPI00244D965B|nr:hypothetical protein [Helicobacter bizzozeronii]GMB92710.1 hypothetical protein NHP200010_04210 [Helicobacter bizzozeronii]